MMLNGVRFTSLDESGVETPLAEFRLSGSSVAAVSGQETAVVDDALRGGISLMMGDARDAVRIGQRWGIEMVAEERTYTTGDGLQFLVALLAQYKGSGYGGVYPVEA